MRRNFWTSSPLEFPGKENLHGIQKASGLGRGLGALLGDDVLQTESTGSLSLPISQVESCSSQPRKSFDEASLAELADSICEHGIIQPLIVQKKDDFYTIIAGERRWRAARLAGLTEIPVIIRITRQWRV